MATVENKTLFEIFKDEGTIEQGQGQYRVDHGQNEVGDLVLRVVRELRLHHVIVEGGVDEDGRLDGDLTLLDAATLKESSRVRHRRPGRAQSSAATQPPDDVPAVTRRSAFPTPTPYLIDGGRFDAEELVARRCDDSPLRTSRRNNQ